MNDNNYYADDKILKFYIDNDGTLKEYDDTYDITIHCTSEDEQKSAIAILKDLTGMKRDFFAMVKEIEGLESMGHMDLDEVLKIVYRYRDGLKVFDFEKQTK